MSLFDTLRFITSHPLNRERKARALLGFLEWQITSRLRPGPVIHDWIDGSRFIVRRGETGLTGNLYCGLHELPEMAFVLHTAGPGDLFVDVGANAGSYTILACAARGARGCCFEPVPATFARLVENLRLNDLLGRVEPLHAGLSDAEGELVFTATEDTTNHVLAPGERADAALHVKVTTLDAALSGRSPTMLKIDVEGFEARVLAGAGATLSSASLQSVIVELNGSGARYGFDDEQIVAALERHGLSPWSYDPFSRTLSPLAGKDPRSGNTLFLRDAAAVRAKLATSPPVKVGDVTF